MCLCLVRKRMANRVFTSDKTNWIFFFSMSLDLKWIHLNFHLPMQQNQLKLKVWVTFLTVQFWQLPVANTRAHRQRLQKLCSSRPCSGHKKGSSQHFRELLNCLHQWKYTYSLIKINALPPSSLNARFPFISGKPTATTTLMIPRECRILRCVIWTAWMTIARKK